MSSSNLSVVKKAFAITMVLTMVLLTACQQKQNKKESLRRNRGLRGSTEITTANPTVQSCGTYSVAGKKWGEVVMASNQTTFYNAVLQLVSPVTSQLSAEDQLGNVSGSSGQRTGVRFWGNVKPVGNAIDASTAEIRIEIYDDKACTLKSDGKVRTTIPIHIGAGLPDFVRASGSIYGTRITLNFVDTYGSIILEGSVVNGYYQGTMSYTVQATGTTPQVLGNFQVPYSGFFTN